jgi:linoleoyl-CoA desaturase
MSTAEYAACRPDAGELQHARWRLYLKAVIIGALSIGSYVGLLLFAHGPLVAMLLAGVLVIALIATSTSVMHDANHGSFAKSAGINHALGYTADILGASSWLWRYKHNSLHHGNTNVVGTDTDIEQMPFARLAVAQPWRKWHRYQHIYMWPLYGFLTVQWFLFSDFICLATKRVGSQPLRRAPRRRDLAMLFAGKVVHVGWAVVLPLMFHRWWTVVAFYFAVSWLVGFALAVFFQVAHCVDNVEFAEEHAPRRGDDFALHQLRTTSDVGCETPVIGAPLAWLMGGLHKQVEHHLAPGTPHTAYRAMSARVRAQCSTDVVVYRVHRNMWTALRAHARWLRLMGRPVSGAGPTA